MPEFRLGDILDDYCGRCRLITNHSIVSLVKGEPAKMQCRTCFNEHNYRQGKAPEKRGPSSHKAKLFDEVLSSITGAPPETQEPADKPKRKRP